MQRLNLGPRQQDATSPHKRVLLLDLQVNRPALYRSCSSSRRTKTVRTHQRRNGHLRIPRRRERRRSFLYRRRCAPLGIYPCRLPDTMIPLCCKKAPKSKTNAPASTRSGRPYPHTDCAPSFPLRTQPCAPASRWCAAFFATFANDTKSAGCKTPHIFLRTILRLGLALRTILRLGPGASG